ncbi:hypothetical protein MIMGU_mgv1a025256mg, partial [Erythranthe guttata]
MFSGPTRRHHFDCGEMLCMNTEVRRAATLSDFGFCCKCLAFFGNRENTGEIPTPWTEYPSCRKRSYSKYCISSPKKIVRTSVLSKSWRNIWCTRPNLDFSDATFKGSKQEFLSLVDKNLQRHCDQRVRIEEFGLCISLDESDRESVSRLENWIRALTNMGTKKFCLSIRSELEHGSGFFHLHSVVFEVAESLQDLRVKILTSDQKSYKRTILSKHLKELHLQNVYINDKDFQRIISSCPLVETASLESCKGLQNIKVNNSLRNLKKFSFYKMPSTEDERCSIEIHPPSSIQTIDIDNGDLKFHKGADFRNLEYLYLRRVTTSSDQLSWCKFPSLQLLDIDCCNGLKELRIFIDAPRI